MAIRSTPSFLQAGSHPAEETRIMLGGMLGMPPTSFAGGISASNPCHGVITANDLAVTQNGTPNMTVNVAVGGAFIRGTESLNQGLYHVWNDATVSLNIGPADATNARKDLVIAQVQDGAYSGSTNAARLFVVAGTPSSSPVDPSLTAYPNALVLARITVAANDAAINTADITDLRPIANQVGKLPVFTSTTAATTAIPSPYDGQGYYLNTGTLAEGPQYWNGSAYRLPWNMPWGYIGATTRTTNLAATNANIITYSLTPVANRRYRITAGTGSVSSSVDSDIAGLAIYAAGTKVSGVNIWCPFANTGYHGGTTVGYYVSTSSTGVTIAAYGERVSGSGTITWGASSTSPIQLYVEDIGPSGAPA